MAPKAHKTKFRLTFTVNGVTGRQTFCYKNGRVREFNTRDEADKIAARDGLQKPLVIATRK